MTVQLDEWAQWTDASGTPLSSGKLYIGTVNLAPRTNLITIYSDRDLTVPIANPQTLDAYGKATTRIFIPGKYSYAVDDSAAVQVEIALDAGASGDTGTTSLDNVLGTNTITASGEATTVTEYNDKEVYSLKIANTNTDAVTFNFDGVGAKAGVKNFDQPIAPGDFTQFQIIRVQYNSTSDNFAWVDASVKTKRITKGSDIASATSITVLDNDGNYFDITGTTTIATINGVAGTVNTFQMDGAVTFTNSAGLILTGGADFTSAAGDVLEFYQLTSSTVINTNIIKADGTAVIAPTIATQTVMETATNDTDQVTPLSTNWHPGVAKAWLRYSQQTPGINASHNITSVTDSSTGLFIVILATDFSSVNYGISAVSQKTTSGTSAINLQGGVTTTAGSAAFQTTVAGPAVEDMISYISFFGDQA